jgi:hypothetical protein
MDYLKRIVRLLAAIFFFALSTRSAASAQDSWLRDDDANVDLISKISPSVMWVYDTATQATGSGVMVNFPIPNKSEAKSLLVTNFHVIHDPDDVIVIWFFGSEGKLVRNGARYWYGDKASDIALLETGPLSQNGKADLSATTKKPGPLTVLDTNIAVSSPSIGAIDDIKRGKSAIFLGFPLNIGVNYSIGATTESFQSSSGKTVTTLVPLPAQKVPVIKFGKIAYEGDGSGWFLIDAMNNSGNSGSPVFVKSQFGSGEIGYKLVGIINSYRTEAAPVAVSNGTDTTVIPSLELRLADGRTATIQQNSGLAQVLSIDRITRIFLGGLKKNHED